MKAQHKRPVTCAACGETHEWLDLHYVGVQDGHYGPELELRDCPLPCGNTLARNIGNGLAMHQALGTISRERRLYVGESMRSGEPFGMALWGVLDEGERHALATCVADRLHDLLSAEWPTCCEDCCDNIATELGNDGEFCCHHHRLNDSNAREERDS